MITILSKLFLKNQDDRKDPAVRRAYGVLCGAVGIFLNLLLCAAKLIVGTISGSIAITADALNNLSDAGSSIVTLLGFKIASQKPDKDHPFGHGRVEYISGLIVAFLIMLMGYELGRSSIEKIITPETTDFSVISVFVLAGSILIKLYMAFFNTRIGKSINSAALRATATDSLSDCIATGVVLLCTLIQHFFRINLDAWCGIVVAIFIFIAGFSAAKDTIDPLLGKTPDPEFVAEVEQIVLANPHVNNLHDLIVHDYGPGRVMISVHAEVSSEEDLMLLHDSIDNTERTLAQKLGCDAVIHMDPVAVHDQKTHALLERVTQMLLEINPTLTLHDFRMVSGPTHTNLIFDVVVPYDFPISDEELKKNIIDNILSFEDGNYFAVVTIDKAYC